MNQVPHGCPAWGRRYHVATENCAIGLYLADRYASGRLAPGLDDPARGTYLRWSCLADVPRRVREVLEARGIAVPG